MGRDHTPRCRPVPSLCRSQVCRASRPLPATQALLTHHAADMRALVQLTSLHIALPPDEPGLSLGTPAMAFVSCLSRLEDLALASPWRLQGEHFLPASLPRSLKSLQARARAAGWVHAVRAGYILCR